MASPVRYILFPLLLLALTSLSTAQQSFRPKALIIPVTRDAATLQYVTQIKQRTPSVPINLVLDLGGQSLWVDCDRNYISSTYHPAPCRSAVCSLAGLAGNCGQCFSPPRPGCNNNTCGGFPDNSVTNSATGGELATDAVSVNSTDGSNPGRAVTAPRFPFLCGSTSLLNGLANGVVGMAGLGRTRVSLPSQFAAAFSFGRKFAICLGTNGVVFFGDSNYNFLQNVQITSQSLTYTKLFINPVSTAGVSTAGEPSSDYFIGVTSIKIDEKPVTVNTSLLSIDGQGRGGTKISTVAPYTVLQSSIYKAVVDAYVAASAARGIKKLPSSVAPFGACFNSTGLGVTRLGYAVPTISLVLESESVTWRVFGANSMVQVKSDVVCLGVVDGGDEPRTAIVSEGISWRIIWCNLIWRLLEWDLALCCSEGRPPAPISTPLPLLRVSQTVVSVCLFCRTPKIFVAYFSFLLDLNKNGLLLLHFQFTISFDFKQTFCYFI